MSELKEYLCVEALVPEIKEIPGYLMHMAKYRAPQAEMELVYLKSEADKVIAELEMKLAAAKLVLRLNEPKALYSNLDTISRLNHKIDVVERRELHQKYKRCLAMAKVCYLRFVRYENYLQKLCASNATIAAYKFRMDMYDKWEKRWLKFAKEFKTN